MLQISNLSIRFGEKVIFESIDFSLTQKEIVAIVGKSGVGKTTLLKIIAGLIKANTGWVKLNNEVVERPSSKIGLVFQEYFVFPWLNVERNIMTGMKYGQEKLNKDEAGAKTHKLLQSADLLTDKDKYPSELSGGMLQRVAICRTLAANPSLLLLDEPFGALDLVTRIKLHNLINDIFNLTQQGIIIVTHNINEAVSLADRVILLSGKPAHIAKEWRISKPRKNDSFLKLTDEQDNVLEEILKSLDDGVA
ncbi:MAG: ABC transporter ATP-binding protein [Kiritimatiellaeota bacterium]|nr:ABC transporter ATP-binding protein [Kiritimatiellota bacterium]